MAGLDLPTLLTGTILPEIRRMAYGGAQYLAYGQIACSMELFGACADAKPLDAKNESRKRFELGMSRYMVPVDARYASYLGSKNAYDLYYHLRCGMAHLLRPQGKVAFTGRSDVAADGTTHLEVFVPSGKLVLVIEDFCDNFQVAAGAFVADLPKLDQTKVAGVFLPVHNSPPAAGAAPPSPTTS